MTFDLYISISKTVLELLAIGLVAGAAAYIVNDLIDDNKDDEPMVNPL